MKTTNALAIVSVILTVALVQNAVLGAEPVDIITNGGFEAGLAKWKVALGHSLETGSSTAKSGNACLTGEVTEPNKHLSARQSIRVKAGNRYVCEIAARGTNRTKIVLFIVRDGKRQRVAAWEKLTPKWRRYSTPLPIQADGNVELELVAPSSHGSPAGRIWIDDVALMETEMPPLTSATEDMGFNDDPAMAAADDGSLYVAWNSYRDLTDSLQIARFQFQDDGFERLGNWQVLGGSRTYVLGTTAVPAGDGVFVLYAAEVDKNWDIYAARCGPDGPGRPVAITKDAAVDVNPAAAWQDGALCVAWESNRNGCRQVFAASLRDGETSEATAVSTDGGNSYDPTVAASADGEVCVAWHSFREHNYDIHIRRRGSGGSWGVEKRLTRASGVDRHAVLAVRGDELWLAYEHAVVEKYLVGRTNLRRIIVAKVEPDGLVAPEDYRSSPLWNRCEAPSLGFDRSGRLWVAYLRPRLPRSGWDTYLTCFDGKRWQEPQPISLQKGMDRCPSLVAVGDRWAVAFQADSMPVSWSDVDLTPTAKSNIYLASYDPEDLPAAGAIKCEPAEESEEPFEAADLRVTHGEDVPTQTISYQGKTLQLYYGDLHQHSEVSVCNRLGDQSNRRRLSVLARHQPIAFRLLDRPRLQHQSIPVVVHRQTRARERRSRTVSHVSGRRVDVQLRGIQCRASLRVPRSPQLDPWQSVFPKMVERAEPADARRGVGGFAQDEC